MRSYLWLFVFALALPACAHKKMPQQSASTTAPTPPAQVGPVLVFQRTPCYGTCPAYTASIFADGRVEYEGQRFVPVLGKHTLRLPPSTVAEMLAAAQRINFSQLEERYSRNTSDLPATVITVHPAGQPAKSVFAAEEIPAGLQGYITYLKGQLDPLAGIGLKE
ncbi:hypothetical protein E4631_02910 [Hymenobacter sp. UV11]|uniref:DUF6438 domain-containing protein n=1 Tax=Hymenobacter sp. UV11 TaxID=1849735 RepID=UPI00105F5E05|nr:DUF6438 domain-containing protein [Hymenobacter sp. UV11]TDN38440.1 hypothetical protein A8B98_24100 [Hymenobacter sp. UV11]TFZ67959.1 hypothetical protein E4631_02910 [Hymenobacter sp. UV11]